MDWHAQEFYELTPEGTPALPTPELPASSKKAALPLFIFVAVIVLAIGGALLYRIWNGDSSPPSEITCADGDVNCATTAALETNALSSCISLRDEAKTTCEDLVYGAQARDTNNASLCKKIKSERLKTSCQQGFEAQDAMTRIEGAIVTGNPADCESLPSADDQANCLGMIAEIDDDGDGLALQDEYAAGTLDSDVDADNDGLLDGEEVLSYKTDPRASDTDGDGFTDFQEVQSGYDPLTP